MLFKNVITAPTPSILVVDDEEKLGRFICMLLKRAGYTAQACQNVLEAEKMLSFGSWDIVLTDIVLPGQNGFELVRWARQNRTYLSIIVMTAHSTYAIEAQAKQLGVSAILHKPFTIETLRQTVAQALQPLVIGHNERVPAY